jgi:TRAP-type C4-dicarboxylate transport system permease large subunit
MSHASSAHAAPPPQTALHLMGRTPMEWLVSLPTIILLMLVLVISTGELVHGRLLAGGEALFGNAEKQVQYYALRADPEKPDCPLNLDIEREVASRMAAQSSGPKDAIEDLFDSAGPTAEQLRHSLEGSLAECRLKQAFYERSLAGITPAVIAYRTVETSFFGLYRFGAEHRSMILLMLMGVVILAATLQYEHIGLVPVVSRRDHMLQSVTTLGAGGFMLWSAASYYQIAKGAGVAVENPQHHIAWIVVFAMMVLISLWQLARPPAFDADTPQGTWAHAFQSAPLAGNMAIFAGVYFALHGHPSGLAIYINTLMELPNLPLQLALFIWGGMLFKQSHVVDLFMNLLRPWRLSPEALTFLVLMGAAIPTAFTGGSGAFVMAAGAIIYHEVRAVGGSSQFALAATAMSGSLGVVLRPSLLVVAIVAVNKEVTSSELFHYGLWVFGLTSTLFLIVSQWRRERHTITVASPAEALPVMLRQIPPLLPHFAVVAAVILFFQVGLHTQLNENTAATIMPIIMLMIVAADKFMLARGIGQPRLPSAYVMQREKRFEPAVRTATNETVGHLGSYMFLILLSQSVGGMIERSEIIYMFPVMFSSPEVCMGFLMAALVGLGMFMEPLGAILLVAGTLGPIAYKNGIDPVHFWVVVLMSFEVGYLMPPVALNQLLARHVVGDEVIAKADAEVAHLSFYRRYERWILPNIVMVIALLIVGWGPQWVSHHPDALALAKSWIGFVPH